MRSTTFSTTAVTITAVTTTAIHHVTAAAHSVPKVLLCLHYPPLPHNRVSAANFDCPYSFVCLVGWDCVASARRGLAAAP